MISFEGNLVGKKYKPGLKFDFVISVPEKDADEYGLLLEHDGQNDANVNSLLQLPDETKALDIAITDALYVKTERGVYRRALCEDCTDFENPCRKYLSYYD